MHLRSLLATMLATAFLLVPSAVYAAEKVKLNAVSGPVSGGWYLGMGLVVKSFTTAYPDMDVSMLPGNATSNVIQLDGGKADIGIGMHSMNMAASKGYAPYKKNYTNVAAFANLNDVARLNIVVTEESGITSIEEMIAQKRPVRLAYGAVGGAGEVFGGWMLEGFGTSYKAMREWGSKLYSNNFDDIVNMVKDDQLDMVLWVGPGESWFFTELATNTKLRWLPVNDKVIDYVSKKYGLGRGTIPGTLYKGMVGADVPTLTEVNELVVRGDLPEDVVYKLTKSFIDNIEDIRKGSATWVNCTPENACQNTGAPLHPGAIRFYKEKGLLK